MQLRKGTGTIEAKRSNCSPAKNLPRSLTQLRTILRKHTVARPVVLPRAVCWLLVRSQAVAGVEQGDNEHRDAKKESHEKVFTHRHPTSIETRQLRCERSIREGGERGTLSKKSNAFAWRETHPPTRRRPPPIRWTGAPAPAWAMTAARTIGLRTYRSSCWRARLGRARQRLRGPRRLLGRRTHRPSHRRGASPTESAMAATDTGMAAPAA